MPVSRHASPMKMLPSRAFDVSRRRTGYSLIFVVALCFASFLGGRFLQLPAGLPGGSSGVSHDLTLRQTPAANVSTLATLDCILAGPR